MTATGSDSVVMIWKKEFIWSSIAPLYMLIIQWWSDLQRRGLVISRSLQYKSVHRNGSSCQWVSDLRRTNSSSDDPTAWSAIETRLCWSTVDHTPNWQSNDDQICKVRGLVISSGSHYKAVYRNGQPACHPVSNLGPAWYRNRHRQCHHHHLRHSHCHCHCHRHYHSIYGGWQFFQMKQILIRRDCVSYGHL